MMQKGIPTGLRCAASPSAARLAMLAAAAIVACMLAANPLRAEVALPAPIATEDPDDKVSLRTAVAKVDQDVDAAGLVERHLGPAVDLVAGDELRYAIRVRNESSTRLAAGRVQVINLVPVGTRFLPGSAGGESALIEYALDGTNFSADLPPLVAPDDGAEPTAPTGAPDPVAAQTESPGAGDLTIRWTYQQDLEPGAETEVFFHVRLL